MARGAALAGSFAPEDNCSMSTPLESPAPREPHLLKFRLRQMFLVVTLFSLLFALVAATEGPWPWVIVISTLMVAAHVLGNLIGTRLRDTSESVVLWRKSDPRQTSDDPSIGRSEDFANHPPLPETNLRNFGRIIRGLRWYLLGGFTVGLILGATLLVLTIGHRIGWAGWIVGAISGGVLGIWLTFLTVSFTTIARDAWRQADGRDIS